MRHKPSFLQGNAEWRPGEYSWREMAIYGCKLLLGATSRSIPMKQPLLSSVGRAWDCNRFSGIPRSLVRSRKKGMGPSNDPNLLLLARRSNFLLLQKRLPRGTFPGLYPNWSANTFSVHMWCKDWPLTLCIAVNSWVNPRLEKAIFPSRD